MNRETAEKLLALNVLSTVELGEEFKSKTEDDFIKLSNDNDKRSIKYYKISNESQYPYYNWMAVDTKNMSNEDIKLQLEIIKAENTKTIKNILVFFTVLAVIGLCAGVIFALSILAK